MRIENSKRDHVSQMRSIMQKLDNQLKKEEEARKIEEAKEEKRKERENEE